MSTQPLAAAIFREFDANGVPLAGGLVQTYAAGTTTPLATFTDATGSVQNLNPVVLDASGRAQIWLTPGLLYKFVVMNAASQVQYTVDNFPAPAASSVGNTSAAAYEPGGRLTLTSGTPVTTADVTGATTIYYAPYKSAFVPIFDGTNWSLQSIGAGLSQATTDNTKSPAAVVANSNYDLYIWSDAGTIRCTRGPAWSSDTSRGTGIGTSELTQQNGRWVNKNAITNGPGAFLGLYVGTVRSDGSLQINDSLAKRHVWNQSNRVSRTMMVQTFTQWTYNTSAFRQANGSAANQLDFVCGLAEDAVVAEVQTQIEMNASGAGGGVFIGLDNTTGPAAACISTNVTGTGGTGTWDGGISARWEGVPGLGHHLLQWLELGNGVTASKFGNAAGLASGIQGRCIA